MKLFFVECVSKRPLIPTKSIENPSRTKGVQQRIEFEVVGVVGIGVGVGVGVNVDVFARRIKRFQPGKIGRQHTGKGVGTRHT